MGSLNRQVHNAVPEFKHCMKITPHCMSRAHLIPETCPVHPAVWQFLCAVFMPVPFHHLFTGINTCIKAGNRPHVLLSVRAVEVQSGDINHVFTEFFSYHM